MCIRDSYISTSEPASARTSNEESPVAWVDELLTHCSLSLAWYRTKTPWWRARLHWLPFTKIQLERTGKWNTWRLFKKFQWKNFQEQWNVWKGFSVFPVVFLVFKSTLDTTLRFSVPFFGKWNWFVRMVNAIPGRHLLALNFAYHLSKPWTEWYVRVNGKQPETRLGRRQTRDVSKISSCWVNATSRRGI